MRKHILTLFISIASITSVCAAEVVFCSPDTTVTRLGEVEVKARARGSKVTSATPVATVDASHIRLTGITDISDAMRRMPGVNLRDYGGAGGLKTVSVRGLGSEHTAVIYDGVALSDCQAGQIDLSRYSVDNLRSLSLYPTDNSDIYIPARAAASASSLYISSFGAHAADSAGVAVRAKIKGGSFGYINPFARIAAGDGDRNAFSANVEYSHSDNDYPFTLRNGTLVTRERRGNSKMDAVTAELNGSHRLSPASTLAAKIYYYDNSRDLPGQVIYYVSGSDEHLRERNFFGQLSGSSRLSPSLSFKVTGKFNWATSRYVDIDGKYPGGRLDNYYIQRETYLTGSLLWLPVSGWAAVYSADWSWNNLTSNLPRDIKPYRNTILQTAAVRYSAGRLTAMARALWSVYLNGARAGTPGKDRSRLSPSVSVSIRPSGDMDFFLRASYKNIFRMPTFNEAYFDNYGSINLDPEITDQINAGITFQAPSISWLPELVLTCDGYINFVSNKIVAVPYNMFVWSMTNLGKVRVLGLDATLSATAGIARRQSLMLTGSYSYQRAQPRTQRGSSEWMKQVAYIPLNSGSVSLTWLNRWVNIAVHASGCSARYTTNANLPATRIDGYIDTGVSVFRKLVFDRFAVELRGDILNMLDTQYEIVARYPMTGRSWRLSAEFDF